MLKKFIQTALLLVVLCTTATTYAQVSQAPDGIQFQALATDANGHPAAGRVIYVKDAIVAKTATGTIVYSETFKVTASSAGIFTIVLGKGTYASGVSSIANIDWANGPFFLNLKIAVEPTVPTASWNVNNEYVDLGTSQFWSVPYALYAGNVKGADTKLNISDTASMLKPYFTSINLKANIESPTFTGTVSGITKAMVGLANVDNTADINKPVSTATQTALDLKANVTDVTTALDLKVDKVAGKALSTNDYTTAEKTKLAAITGTNTGDQDLSALAIAADVNSALALKANGANVASSLALKANTADVTTSLATKVDKVTGKALSTNDYTTAEKTKLAAIIGTNTGDQDLSALAVAADVNTALALKANTADVNTALALKANSADVTTSLATKVDKVTGKALSTNDYTTAEKTKLAAIIGTNTGDQINITGNAATATKLIAPKNINGIPFDGSADIIIAANASSISGVVPISNGGTGQTTVPGILSTLGFASNNIAIGLEAGTPNQGVNAGTIAIGGGAGRGNQGQASIAIGYVSGDVNQGVASISIGPNAAQANQSRESVAIGYAAGQNNQGTGAIAIGTFAGQSNQAAHSIALNASGTSSPLNPSNAGFYVDPIRSATATTNLLFYNPTSKEVTTASANGSFVDLTTNQTIGGVKTFSNILNINGVSVGPYNGNNNTMVGNNAFSNSTPGANNTAIGSSALSNAIGGNDNTAIGASAIAGLGSATASGWRNTAVGVSALRNGGGGSDNVAVGFLTLPNTTGGANTAVGMYALLSNTSATENVAIGAYAQYNTTVGINNTSIGTMSMALNTSGTQNTAIGASAIEKNISGSNNTVLGFSAGKVIADNSTVNSNVNNSVLIGALSKTLTVNSDNEVVIGYNAVGNGSNTIQLGNTSITNVKTSGTINAGGLSVSGNVAVNTNKFNVSAANGNTSVAGTLDVTGATTLSSATVNGKVIAGASSAASSSAVLEANSTTQGFLPPRMTGAQRNAISSPVAGLVVWCSNCGSNGEMQVYNGTAWTNMIGGTAAVAPYTIGQAALGGKIAYILQSGDPGYDANVQHGLVASTAHQSLSIPWSNNNTITTTGATGIAIGTGLANTNTIITNQGVTATSYAAGLARAYNGGGYTDWYLPSLDELKKLYINRVAIGDFQENWYWSSTESDLEDIHNNNVKYAARIVGFGWLNGAESSMHKNGAIPIRAIRAF